MAAHDGGHPRQVLLYIHIARRRKLQWFGNTTRRPGSLVHDVMHGLVEDARGCQTEHGLQTLQSGWELDYNMCESG